MATVTKRNLGGARHLSRRDDEIDGIVQQPIKLIMLLTLYTHPLGRRDVDEHGEKELRREGAVELEPVNMVFRNVFVDIKAARKKIKTLKDIQEVYDLTGQLGDGLGHHDLAKALNISKRDALKLMAIYIAVGLWRRNDLTQFQVPRSDILRLIRNGAGVSTYPN